MPNPGGPAHHFASRLHTREDDLAGFGDTISVLGLMERTDQDFVDGLALDILSPINRTLTVQQNFSPLCGSFVSGSNGEPFFALSNYSYIIRMNETANDLVAKIELPYDPDTLESIGFNVANTYVGQLSKEKNSWIISESQRNVHVSENKTRIIKMTSLEGEYRLLGRKTEDNLNIFVQYGQGATRTVNITGGSGLQEAEFIDGLRVSILANQPMFLNAEIRGGGVEKEAIPQGFTAVNSYVWSVNTSNSVGLKDASLLVPYTPSRLPANAMPFLAHRSATQQSMAPQANSTGTMALSPAQFTIIQSQNASNPFSMNQQSPSSDTMRFMITGLTKLDGEYLLLTGREPQDSTRGGTGGNNGTTGTARSSVAQTTVAAVTTTRGVNSGRRQVNTASTYGEIVSWALLVALAFPI